MKSIQIEFIGLPGSGKSTISDLVINKLADKNYRVMNRRDQQKCVANHYLRISKKERLASLFDFCESNEALVFHLSKLSCTLRPLHRAGLRRSFIFIKQCQNAAIFHSQDLSKDVDFVIHEQDILQEIWSVLYLRQASDAMLRPLFQSIQDWLPTMTVYIDLNGAVAWERMQERAKRLKHFPGEIDSMKDLDKAILNRSNETTRQLGALAQEFGSTLFTIDGLKSVEESAELITARIESLYSTPKNL